MPKETDDGLTAEQAADVIRYYNNNENKISRERGWKDKVPLGKSAIHTTSPAHTLRPDGEPMLTPPEMNAGLEHIENPPKSDEYYKKLDELNDKGFTYDDARRKLDADGMK